MQATTTTDVVEPASTPRNRWIDQGRRKQMIERLAQASSEASCAQRVTPPGRETADVTASKSHEGKTGRRLWWTVVVYDCVIVHRRRDRVRLHDHEHEKRVHS